MKRLLCVALLVLSAYRPALSLPEDDIDFNTLHRVTILPTASRVESVAFSPDSKMLAAGLQGRIIVWDSKLAEQTVLRVETNVRVTPDPQEPDPLRVTPTAERWVLALAFSPDSKFIAAACSDGTLRQWDIAEGDCVIFSDPALSKTRSPLLSHASQVSALAYSHDGKLLASGSDDKTVKLWDARSGALQRILGGNRYQVLCVAFSADDKSIVSAGAFSIPNNIQSSYARAQQMTGAGEIRTWEAPAGALVRAMSLTGFTSLSVALSPDARIAVCIGNAEDSSGGDPALVFWNAVTGEKVRTTTSTQSFGFDGGAVAFSPYGGIVAVAGRAERIPVKMNPQNPVVRFTLPRVGIWDTSTAVARWSLGPLRQPIRPSAQVRALAISRTARTFAFACNNATVEVWSVQ